MKKMICLFLILLLTGCRQNSEPITQSDFCLDTVVSISLYDSHSNDILNHCFELCNEYELIFSSTNEQSELYKINHSEDKLNYQSLSDDLYFVIKEGLYYSELSNGSFDITIGTVSSLWDFKSEQAQIPDDSSLQKALSHVGYQKIELKDYKIRFLDEKTMIDLGAIAKGYIADQIKEYLISKGVESALIDLGGNILCVGDKLGTDFTIGLTDPVNTGEAFLQLKINDLSVVTSGTYQRYFEINDKRYHHIIDPKTGYSYDNGLASVTIISDSSLQCDALSTVCFSLGKEKGTELLESLDVYGCFIDENNEAFYTEGFEEYMKR